MAQFIRVMGDDPHYPAHRAPLYVNLAFVSKIFPQWAQEREGTLYRCPHDGENARVVGYTLVDSQGNKYSCDKDDLERLGVELESRRGRLGFTLHENQGGGTT